MIGVTSNAFRHDFALWTVTSQTARLSRHKNIGRLPALSRLVANVAIERLLRPRIDLVLGMTEFRLRHPPVDQNRPGYRRGSIGHSFDFMAKRAADEICATARGHFFPGLIRINCKKHSALEFVAAVERFPQLPDLLGNEVCHIGIAIYPLCSRIIGVLGRQGAQKRAGKLDISMGNLQAWIFPIELQGMTRLAVGRESDALVITAPRIGNMAVIAIEFLPVYRRNVSSKMALMIESKHVRIPRFIANQLEFRVAVPKGVERFGVAARWPRRFEHDLRKGMRMSMIIRPLYLHSFSS